MRRTALLRLVVVLLVAPLLRGQDAAPTADVVIVHFNDFHGQVRPRASMVRPGQPAVEVGGFSRLAAYVGSQRAAHGERVWVTNGGDWYQGTPEGNEDRGVAVLDCFDYLAVTASVLGNHEFDFGEAHLLALLERPGHPVLGANVLERGTHRLRPYARPYIVRTVRPAGEGLAGGSLAGESPAGERAAGERAAVRIALVGLVTKDTPNVATGPFGSAEFDDEVATLTRLWPALERDADHVVLLTHCGVRTDLELARQFPGIALILGGHDHRSLREPLREGKTVIVQSGSRAAAVTRVELVVRPDRIGVGTVEFVELGAELPQDPAAERFLRERFAHIGSKWDSKLGEVCGAADRRRAGSSSPAGSFVADLIRSAGDAEIGLTNKGGLRTVWAPGPITRRQVFEMLPFDNTVVTVSLRGDELRQLLDEGLRRGKRPLEIAGASYTFEVVDGERRLLEVEVAGAPAGDEVRYRVATNSFLADGGDGYPLLRNAKHVERNERLLWELVTAHLMTHGVIDLPGDSRIRLKER